VVAHLSDGEEAEAVVEKIRQDGGAAFAQRADVTIGSQVEELIDVAGRRFGSVDILVNNAAVTNKAHMSWTEITATDWDYMHAVNLRGCFLTFRAAYTYLKESGHGRVINISSGTFHTGQARMLHYVSSKGGVIGFTRSLAREVGPDQITVNAVTHGAIRTENELEQFPDQGESTRRLLDLQSLKRRGAPEDIAAVVAFLGSDDSSFITGQTINVDGGWAMH